MDADQRKVRTDDNELTSNNRQDVRQRIPLKMFGKKYISKKLLVSSKVWMHTIPTQDCDIVLTLPASTEDSTLMWLLARLRARTPRILVHVRHHSSSGIYGLYMTANYESLLEGAEELGIRKPLKKEFGGGMKEFIFEDQGCFEGVEVEEGFLSSQERQSIVRHMLNNLRAVEGDEVEKIKLLEGQPIVPRLLSKKVVSSVFPLHSHQSLVELRKSWVQAFFQLQPLDAVKEYFGVKISLYFAYLGHYTSWLIFPTFLGIMMWLMQFINQMCQDLTWIAFSIFNVFWATLYLIHWKRTSASHAYRWGTLDMKDELLRDPRPLYKGILERSPITGHLEPHYPAWKRHIFCYFISMPVIFLCLMLVFIIMLLIFEIQEWINLMIVKGDIPSFLSFAPKLLLVISISVMDELYKKVAVWLTNKENYRLEESHEKNLIIKLVLFQFVNSFLSLFYIAFYLRDMNRLREQLAALLITRQVLGNIKETLLPYIMWKARLYKVGYRIASEMSNNTLDQEMEKVTSAYKRKLYHNDLIHRKVKDQKIGAKEKLECQDADSRESVGASGSSNSEMDGMLTQAEVESAMTTYEDTYEDYLEMLIQFGYVTLFSSAFPLAALCALLNNIIEIRGDAFKLCYTHQRPFGTAVENIGIWQSMLQLMVVIAVMVNSALIATSGLLHRLDPTLSDTAIILIMLSFEHIILAFKLAVEHAITDIPSWVATEMAKVEYQHREVLRRLEGGATSVDPRDRKLRGSVSEPDIADVMSSSRSMDDIQSFQLSPPRRITSWQSASSSFQGGSHTLIGHRPQNFSNNRCIDAMPRTVYPGSGASSRNPWKNDERRASNSTSGTEKEGTGSSWSEEHYVDRALSRNPFERDRQIYRRTCSGRAITRQDHFSSGRILPTLPSSSGSSLHSDSAVAQKEAGSVQREITSPQDETNAVPREVSAQHKESISPFRGANVMQRDYFVVHRDSAPQTEITASSRDTVSPVRNTTLPPKEVSSTLSAGSLQQSTQVSTVSTNSVTVSPGGSSVDKDLTIS